MEIVTAEEMMMFDQVLIDRGYSSEILMENAGSAFIDASIDFLGTIPRRVVVFCGPGYNGGDGMVVARKFLLLGSAVTIIFCCNSSNYQGAAKMNYELLLDLHPAIELFVEDKLDAVRKILHSPDVDLIVDAIYGIGFNRAPEPHALRIFEEVNGSGISVGSIDIASGVNATSGKMLKNGIKASFCLVIGLMKSGCLLYDGYAQCSKLYYSLISAPYTTFHSHVHLNSLVPLPPRNVTGHKGSFGQALFIAGAKNYYGAPYFSSYAFLKSGGRYARLATVASICPVIASLAPEIVFIPMAEVEDGYISPENGESLAKLAKALDIICLGPGISTRECVSKFVKELLPQINKPILIDGDAITIIANELSLLEKHATPWVLTPHLAEFARLTSKTVEYIQENRIPLLQEYARKWNAFIVLKDARTVIAEPGGNCWINTSGNDGLAKAGSGDVLSGIICALACQTNHLLDAVRTAVFLHGYAADLAASECGKDSLTATKLLEFIPKALQSIRTSPASFSHYNIKIVR